MPDRHGVHACLRMHLSGSAEKGAIHELPEVRGDDTQLTQVVLNLV